MSACLGYRRFPFGPSSRCLSNNPALPKVSRRCAVCARLTRSLYFCVTGRAAIV
ncbi:hypothetical protein KCP78_06045 [Salmonella enterica subsp. enterica]|nr:hypothetical protein KCP78_06045 [Salmonella enterica subsp. enterica]